MELDSNPESTCRYSIYSAVYSRSLVRNDVYHCFSLLFLLLPFPVLATLNVKNSILHHLVSIETRLRPGRPELNSLRGQRWGVSLHHRVQTDSGSHRTSYPMATGGYVPVGKAAGA